MQIMRWVSVLIAGLVIAACFFPWVSYNNEIVSGFNSTVTVWGKPGIMHVFFSSLFIVMVLAGKVWSLRLAFFLGAFNMAWALRNFFMITACEGGVCPEKHLAIYVILLGSLLYIIAFFLNHP